jgi:hypothetical protein
LGPLVVLFVGAFRTTLRRTTTFRFILLLGTFFFVPNKKMMNLLQSRSQKEFLYNAIVLAIYVIILTILLRFLWNKSLVKHISVLKPVDTLWHTFLLAVAVAAFKC